MRGDTTISAAGKRANGVLEGEILAALWSAAEPMTPGQVQKALNDRIGESGRHIAYQTALTTLTRLLEKGQVTRQRRGRAHAYAPALARDAHAAARMRALLGEGSSRHAVLAHFVESLDDGEEALLRLLLHAD